MLRLALAGLILALALALPAPAGAVRTEYYRYARMEDYQDASFRELVLSDDGSWRLGPRWEDVLTDEVDYFSELADDGKTLLLAGGSKPGKLVLYDKAGGRQRQIHSAEDQLFACAEVLGRGEWVAGSGPGGTVYRVNAAGDLQIAVATGEEFVWDLLRDGGTLWIATGSRGAILKHDLASGRTETFATLPDQSVFCLALDAEGRLLAGTSGSGLVYRFTREGRAEQLADFDAEEIQALVAEPDGALVVAAAQAEPDCEENCAAVYRLHPGGLLEKLLGSDSAFIGDLLPAPGGGLWVAAGDPGELDLLTGPYHGEVLGVEPERYYSDLALDADGETLWLLQSKPARLTRIAGRAAEGTLTSEVLDLNNRSRMGSLWLEAERPRGCAFTVEARAGHGSEPGEGWTDWQRGEETVTDTAVSYGFSLPAARYFQWRIKFEGAGERSPRLHRVTASFLPLNRAPLVGNFNLLRPEAGPFEDAIDLGGRPFTQVLERGVRVQYQQKSGPEPAADPDLAAWRGLRELHWDWLDPDADRLRARIELQREGESAWRPLVEEWPSNSYTWDTRGLPDGFYRLRLTVDDGLDNGAGHERASETLSERVLLDSEAPVCALALERRGGAIRLKGSVSDAASLLTRVQLRVGDAPWRSLVQPDGLMDRRRLDLDLELESPDESDGPLELRAGDEYGNWGYFRSVLPTPAPAR